MSLLIDFVNEARHMSFVPKKDKSGRPVFYMPPFPSKFIRYGDKNVAAVAERAHYCAMGWNDILEYYTVFTEHEEFAYKMACGMLGYQFWCDRYRYPGEVKIRRLTERFNKKEIAEEEYMEEVSSIVKVLRNLDMRLGKFCKVEQSDEDIRRYAIEDNLLYSNEAREKLAHFLGYYPDLRYSLPAELYLRDYMNYEQKHFPKEHETDAVIRAMTVVKYREVLLHEGQDAADQSPLVGYSRLLEKALGMWAD